jgi:hypothetical protein
MSRGIKSAIAATFSVLAAFVLLAGSRNLRSAVAATEPTINKASILVTTYRHTVYLATPNGEKDYTTWSWTPGIAFRVNGPMAGGSSLVVEFSLPGDKPWVKLNCGGGEISADQWWQVGDPFCGDEVPDEQAKTVTGPVDFKISLTNEPAGTNKTLFTGRVNVKKVHIGLADPQFKNNFDYYVDQDWSLPIGYVYAMEPTYSATGASQYVNSSPLGVSMWFRGEPGESSVVGYVFYNGKQIGSTENTRQGTVGVEAGSGTADESPFKWSLMSFTFSNVLVFNNNPPGMTNPDAFRLDKNPGEYEIKVLRNGKPARAAKFSVGADGKIVDSGVTKNNHLGAPRLILPVQVLGTDDGDWDKTAWKSGAFYANPLSGFAAP